MKYGWKTSLLVVCLLVPLNAGAQSVCGEEGCVPAQATYISHFTGTDCSGTESYYLPYDSYAYDCRTWNGGGECGTVHRTVTNRSYVYNGVCFNAWPSGNSLDNFVTVYREPVCQEPDCVPAQAAYISHFTGADCTGTESYYLPYQDYAYECRTWNGKGECGLERRTVTNRSYLYNGICYKAWPSGNTLSDFVTVYRPAPVPVSSCREPGCIPAQGSYISHFTGADCTGTESYYLPYQNYAYDCRTWNGTGDCGTTHRTVTNRSYLQNGICHNAWPSGNTLSHFVTVYRRAPEPPCREPNCVSVQAAYVSHFTGADCQGTESYYLPYQSYAYNCRTWNGSGKCGTVRRTVTNRSYRYNGTCYNAWPSGNTLSDFVTIYRPGSSSSPQLPVACGTMTPTGGRAPLFVSLNGGCSYDPDGGSILSYRWDLGGTDAVGSPTQTILFPGTHPVWLTVRDDEGQSSSDLVGFVVVF